MKNNHVPKELMNLLLMLDVTMYQVGDLIDSSSDITATTLSIAYNLARQMCEGSDELVVGVWAIGEEDVDLVAIVHQGEVFTR